MKHIVEINKFFRSHHVPSAWRKGQLICLDSYQTNWTYYIKFIQDHPDEVDRTIAQKIMDMHTFLQVSDSANMLRPVAAALDLGQNDKTTIADACNNLMNLLSEPILQDHRDKVQKGFDLSSSPATWLPT